MIRTLTASSKLCLHETAFIHRIQDLLPTCFLLDLAPVQLELSLSLTFIFLLNLGQILL